MGVGHGELRITWLAVSRRGSGPCRCCLVQERLGKRPVVVYGLGVGRDDDLKPERSDNALHKSIVTHVTHQCYLKNVQMGKRRVRPPWRRNFEDR